MPFQPLPLDYASPAPLPPAARAAEAGSAQALAEQWEALEDAGAAVAALAGVVSPPDLAPRLADLAMRVQACGGRRLELASQLIEDLRAIMRPGLTALLAANARQQDAAAAATALWHEFVHAREALLALVPERCDEDRRRSA